MNLEVESKSDLHNILNLCRLCTAQQQLVSVFDKFDGPKPLTEIVAAVTTIKIKKEDKVSQKICKKCISTAMNMFEFRSQAIITDKNLKEKYTQISKTAQSTSEEADKTKKDTKTEDEGGGKKNLRSQTGVKKEGNKPTYVVHPSITQLFKKYPTVRVPSVSINLNINPTVVMEMDTVENYFIKRNLNLQKYINYALNKQNRVAKKSTSAPATRAVKKMTIPEYFLSMKSNNGVFSDKQLYSRDLMNGKLTKVLPKPSSGDGHARPSCFKRKSQSPLRGYPSHPKRTRKLSSSSCSSHQSDKEPLFVDMTENSSPSCSSPASTVIDDVIPDLSCAKAKEMYVCNVCNSVYSQASSLKRHQSIHLRCQFCKALFKTLGLKDHHVENSCKIRKIMKSMTDLPTIPLQKVEQNASILKQFRNAFSAYNLIPNESISQETSNISKKTKTSSIIQLISNEDEAKNTSTKEPLRTEIQILDSKLNNLIPMDNMPDAKLIKTMLLQYNKLNRKFTNASQTILPTNALIKMNHVDMTVDLKFLKHYLFYYKIPLDINNASFFNISYKRDFGVKEKKRLQKWDDLTCCDINFVSQLDASREVKQERLENSNAEKSKEDERLAESYSNIESDEMRCQTDNSDNLDPEVDAQHNIGTALVTDNVQTSSSSLENIGNQEECVEENGLTDGMEIDSGNEKSCNTVEQTNQIDDVNDCDGNQEPDVVQKENNDNERGVNRETERQEQGTTTSLEDTGNQEECTEENGLSDSMEIDYANEIFSQIEDVNDFDGNEDQDSVQKENNANCERESNQQEFSDMDAADKENAHTNEDTILSPNHNSGHKINGMDATIPLNEHQNKEQSASNELIAENKDEEENVNSWIDEIVRDDVNVIQDISSKVQNSENETAHEVTDNNRSTPILEAESNNTREVGSNHYTDSDTETRRDELAASNNAAFIRVKTVYELNS